MSRRNGVKVLRLYNMPSVHWPTYAQKSNNLPTKAQKSDNLPTKAQKCLMYAGLRLAKTFVCCCPDQLNKRLADSKIESLNSS